MPSPSRHWSLLEAAQLCMALSCQRKCLQQRLEYATHQAKSWQRLVSQLLHQLQQAAVPHLFPVNLQQQLTQLLLKNPQHSEELPQQLLLTPQQITPCQQPNKLKIHRRLLAVTHLPYSTQHP